MLTAKRLREVLDYNPDTGEMRWRHRRSSRRAAGSIAGCIVSDGYRRITVERRQYISHRLIWLWMTGEWPLDEIDHRDLNKDNNRWNNLRAATRAQNTWNKKKLGAHRHGRGWIARIKVNNHRHYLGTFDTREEAKTAYKEASVRFHGEFARTIDQ